ncbi:MAG: hypothetical protein BGP14_13100 [Sphingobacteriales bacterium 44-15]|nr:MAG: hypothetical protein BGP14_13100 [Sphingobacteriales bacterium 44-15]
MSKKRAGRQQRSGIAIKVNTWRYLSTYTTKFCTSARRLCSIYPIPAQFILVKDENVALNAENILTERQLTAEL